MPTIKSFIQIKINGNNSYYYKLCVKFGNSSVSNNSQSLLKANEKTITHDEALQDAIIDAGTTINSWAKTHKKLYVSQQPEYFIDDTNKDIYYTARNSKEKDLTKKQYDNLMNSEIQDVTDNIIPGDKVTLTNIKNPHIVLPLVTVQTRNGYLGFSTKNMKNIINTKDKYIMMQDIEDYGFTMTQTQRVTVKKDVHKNYIPKLKEYAIKPSFKSGSMASLHESYNNVKAVYEYFEVRRENGDTFLDQWMSDAYDTSKNAMKEIENLINILNK